MDRLSQYLRLVDEMPGAFDLEKTGEKVVTDLDLLKSKEEELDKEVGVLYEDEHILLVVDLLHDEKTDRYRTKGRIIHRHGGATIIIPITERKDFILTEQFRHATQKGQLSFPRSFEYDGLSGRKHAGKLAKDLLCAAYKRPLFLGELTAESDLVNMKFAVYLVPVVNYHLRFDKNSGVVNAAVLSQYQMESAIRRMAIDDSLTVAAFGLWKAYKAMRHKTPKSTF